MNRSEKNRRKRPREYKPNPLSENAMTLGEAIQRYRLTGKPVPAHLKHQVFFVSGTEEAKADGPLPQKLRIGDPFYRMGDQAHTGNPNPCQARQPRIPGK